MSCMQGGACGKNDDEAQKYADERKLTLYKLQVPMRKLSDIFAENNMSNFGWILVDVEGAKTQYYKQSISARSGQTLSRTKDSTKLRNSTYSPLDTHLTLL